MRSIHPDFALIICPPPSRTRVAADLCVVAGGVARAPLVSPRISSCLRPAERPLADKNRFTPQLFVRDGRCAFFAFLFMPWKSIAIFFIRALSDIAKGV